jgi:hypothetical protein
MFEVRPPPNFTFIHLLILADRRVKSRAFAFHPPRGTVRPDKGWLLASVLASSGGPEENTPRLAAPARHPSLGRLPGMAAIAMAEAKNSRRFMVSPPESLPVKQLIS